MIGDFSFGLLALRTMRGWTAHCRATAVIVCVAAGLILVSIISTPAAAQEDRPYDGQLVRLGEILGAVHYLRELCGAEEGQLWRNQMRDLIDSEGSTALRRVKFVKSFNKGYRGYRRTYRNCTQSAKVAINRFMAEGAKVAKTLIEKNK